MSYRYSAIESYNKCPYQYKKRYIDNVVNIKEPTADNALIVGSTLHIGIEKGIDEALRFYSNAFKAFDDNHWNEIIKFEYLIPKALHYLEWEYGEKERIHELSFSLDRYFEGTIDLLVYVGDGYWDLIDFKYSNNIDNYLKSKQLHVYKYCIEKYNFKIRDLRYMFIPKPYIKQDKGEGIGKYRHRLVNDLKSSKIKFVTVEYSQQKAIDILKVIPKIENDERFDQKINDFCFWCDYWEYCFKGVDYKLMRLPENKLKKLSPRKFPDMWIYGDSYTGKTTFIDSFDDVIFINTDGNIEDVVHPVIRIKDEILKEGRITKKVLAWQQFLDTVELFETEKSSFKIICIDLVEDMLEHCRLYMYSKLKIDHEHDAGFGKGYDMVKTEFLSTMKRLKNTGYKIVFISKLLSKEVTKPNGATVTTFNPNIKEYHKNVISGMVALTGLIQIQSDGKRTLYFGKRTNLFSGTRLKTKQTEIDLNRKSFEKFLESLNSANLDIIEKVENEIKKK